METATLEFRQISSTLCDSLTKLFASFETAGLAEFFHPHPFTPEYAKELSEYSGKDLYFLLLNDGQAIGYGMLRGWDEGYEVPSLGIAIHPEYQGLKLSRALMEFLHCAARLRGAPEVMLKVYNDNAPAVHLYQSMGYDMSALNDKELRGRLALTKSAS